MFALIVDDDIPTTQAVRDAVNWASFGISRVECAYNVASAKEIVALCTPDVVVCDIEMPKGSGLDFIRWARENGIESQFIFLTCHEDFSFAKSALEYAASAYITKPFDVHKMHAAIGKAVHTLAENRRVRQEGEYWQESQGLIRESFWRDLIFRRIPPEAEAISAELRKSHLALDENAQWRPVLVAIGRSDVDKTGWEEQHITYALRNMAAELLLGRYDAAEIFVYPRPLCYYCVAVIDAQTSEMQLEARCDKLLAAIRAHFGCMASAYIGRLCPLNGLADERGHLEAAYQNNVAVRGKVLRIGSISEASGSRLRPLDIEAARELLVAGKAVDLINDIRGLLETLAEEGHLNHELLRGVLHDYMQLVYTVLYERNIQAHKLFAAEAAQQMLAQAEHSIFDAMHWVSYLTLTTVDYMRETSQSESIVEKIKRYIQQNYAQPLTRDTIAAEVYLTPNYVSKLFRSRTGQYLKDYINDVRLQHAKELLLSGSKSVSDIAGEVGFDNFSYFSTLFKKNTGLSPSQFRKGE